MSEPRTTVRSGVLRLTHPGTRWLSTGWDGGFVERDAAYNVSVPTGFDRTDLEAYVAERRREARFDAGGPALLTGVEMRHARGARSGSVTAVVTAGVSNPAGLPASGDRTATLEDDVGYDPGTVNVLLSTTRALDDGALASLLGVAVEAKAATLLAETGFPGTTTDAAVVGCDPAGSRERFAGSGTPVGAAARACVRDALRASLRSRYPDGDLSASVADAEYGVSTDHAAEVFRVRENE
ncbi:MAG: adenosylcobinamide amidohydrolase [Haloarculaceae archaeon]